MVGITGDRGVVLCNDLYRERLSVGIGKVCLFADCQLLGSRKLCKLDRKDRLRIRLAVSLLRHEVYRNSLSDLHICDRLIEAADHHSGTADEL